MSVILAPRSLNVLAITNGPTSKLLPRDALARSVSIFCTFSYGHKLQSMTRLSSFSSSALSIFLPQISMKSASWSVQRAVMSACPGQGAHRILVLLEDRQRQLLLVATNRRNEPAIRSIDRPWLSKSAATKQSKPPTHELRKSRRGSKHTGPILKLTTARDGLCSLVPIDMRELFPRRHFVLLLLMNLRCAVETPSFGPGDRVLRHLPQ